MTSRGANHSPERSSHSYQKEKKPPQGIYIEEGEEKKKRSWQEREKETENLQLC